MIELVQGVKTAAVMAKVGLALTAARNGDPEAIAYLRQDGLFEALEAMSPGTGMMAREAVFHGTAFLRALKGEAPRSIAAGNAEPWGSFLRWKMQQPSGANIFVGQTGSGKTSMCSKLVVRAGQANGYPLEFCNYYGDDIPRGIGATIITAEVLIARLERVKKELRGLVDVPEVDDESVEIVQPDVLEADEVVEEMERRLSRLPFYGRAIAIDEMGMNDNGPQSKEGKAFIRALTQSRHLGWIVGYVGQMFGQFPRPLLGQSCIYVKKPTGREADMDRQLTWVRDIWRRSAEAFAEVRREPGWVDYPDERAWAYVEAPAGAGGFTGYTGLMPFSRLEGT